MREQRVGVARGEPIGGPGVERTHLVLGIPSPVALGR
jgi:hypothetical protein